MTFIDLEVIQGYHLNLQVSEKFLLLFRLILQTPFNIQDDFVGHPHHYPEMQFGSLWPAKAPQSINSLLRTEFNFCKAMY